VKAGLHTVAVTSPRESLKPERDAPPSPGAGTGGGGAAAIPMPVDVRLDGARVKRFDVFAMPPEINKLIVGGPYQATGRGDTPSRRKVFSCRPTRAADEPACARTILTALARRAFRRPVTSADFEPLFAFDARARRSADGPADFEGAIQPAIEAMLVSPDFLFRIEQDLPSASGPHRINDIELASRVSFFLWSSLPDEELIELA